MNAKEERIGKREVTRGQVQALLSAAARSGLPEALGVSVVEAARILLEWRSAALESERQQDAVGWYCSRVESCQQPFLTW